MVTHSDFTAGIVVVVVNFCWLGFFVILLMGRRGAVKSEAKRDLKSHIGFILQCIAYAICFLLPRRYFSPFLPMSRLAENVMAAVTIVIAVSSVWFCFESARLLGRQWSLVARVIEGHELVTTGPYALVRNPIYLAMFGMLLVTGFAFTRWQVLLGALVIYLVGTEIRIQSEERLLRDAFGARFEQYTLKVPALFPRM